MTAERKRSIAIVTEHRELSRLIRDVLNGLGFHAITEIDDPAMAFDKLRQKDFGLVVSDWDMRSVSGLTLLKETRAVPMLRSMRFVMMSGIATDKIVAAVKAAGADGFILKPFSVATLKRQLFPS